MNAVLQGRRCMSRARRVAVAAAVGALAMAVPLVAGPGAWAAPHPAGRATTTAPRATGTVIEASHGSFGPMLVVGSGQWAGYSLYGITSDHGSTFGCTTKKRVVLGSPGTCTGPSSDKSAEWPAITTRGTPVAGKGVKQSLLGEVKRAGIGEQITYASHPLYLFDQAPGLVSGEGWDEPDLAPDHGVWWLLKPSTGAFQPWAMTLSTTIIGGKKVLGVEMQDGGNFFVFPVYRYSGGNCSGACAAAWPPAINQGRPGILGGISRGAVGTTQRSDGTRQLTYHGHRLYLYSHEQLVSPTGLGPTGNGDGKKGPHGTFSLLAA
jgi:predicted lipoprotein with Yx(FWY)xxD motif